MSTSRPFGLSLAVLCCVLALGGSASQAQTLDSVTPDRQRVGEIVTLRGSGFGAFDAAVSRVRFVLGADAFEAGAPYVWRDGFIQVRVPVGRDLGGGVVELIPKVPLEVEVVAAGGTSGREAFRVIAAANQPLPPSFVERTEIVNDRDVATFLGDPDFNLARTKDGEVADVNGDGYPDLLDNNSSNLTNDTISVLHLNRGGQRFAAVPWEPRNSSDTGPHLVVVPNGGTYSQDFTTYDGDLMDLTNDGLPDWVQALRDGSEKIRVAINGHLGVPGRFLESTGDWVPNNLNSGSPDDLAHTDTNHDGWVDLAIAFRFAQRAQILLNNQGTQFAQPIDVISDGGATSIHDVFFLDANADQFPDVFLVNESGDSQLFLNDGSAVPTWNFSQAFGFQAQAGAPADFNGDGLLDFVLGGTSVAAVFINRPGAPGTFTQVTLPNPGDSLLYDVEVGDMNLDGLPDILAAGIPTGFTADPDDSLRVWINRGAGEFRAVQSTSSLFPGLTSYQRMSADTIDFDLDGDLDLYLTGADGSGITGFGDVANQFWENLLIDR